VDSFADLLLVQNAANVDVSYGTLDTLSIEHIIIADLTVNDFVFT